jgi:cell division transport system permease protein
MSVGEQRAPIGITTIWAESEGIERVSLWAVTAHCVRQAIENVRRSPITHILTIVTIAVAIFLLGIFSLFISNSSRAVSRQTGEMVVMIFLRDSSSQADVDAMSNQVRQIAPGLSVTYSDKTQALLSFRNALGDDARILDGLDSDNPLPASINVALGSAEEAERIYHKVSDVLGTHSKVESIRYSRGGVMQIKRMLRIVEVVGVVGIVFLFVIAGFIIANTIKLALYNHRMEIEIMQLVGARRGSIYAPYLLEGLVQGVLGASIGTLGVFIVYLVLRSVLSKAEVLSMLVPSFTFIPLTQIAVVVLAGAIVGVGGSYLAVRRYLSES